MTKASIDGVIDDYLRRLQTALSRLPEPRRSQLVGEISEHIAESRNDLPNQTEQEIRDLLDRVGRPEDIAAEALADELELVDKSSHRGLIAVLIVVAAMIVGFGTWAIVAHDNHHVTATPPLSKKTTTTTVSTSDSGPTLATCTSAVTGFYSPPLSWSFGGTISSDQGVGYGCENQEMLANAMMKVVNANVTPTSAGEASGAYGVNSAGQIIVPNGQVIGLYQTVCNVLPKSTLCING